MTLHRTALLLLTGIAFSIMGCASKPSAAPGPKRPPLSPEQVVLYFEQPVDFEVIGTVRGSSGARYSDERSVEHALKELKKRAAELGANGLLLDPEIDTKTDMDWYRPLRTKTIQGIAIFVKGR